MKVIFFILAIIPSSFLAFFGCIVFQQASNSLDHPTVWVVRGFGIFVVIVAVVLFFRIRSYLNTKF